MSSRLSNSLRPLIPSDEPTVALVADWDGNNMWARAVIKTLTDRNVHSIVHLGEYGSHPGTTPHASGFGRDWYFETVSADCMRYGVKIWLVGDPDAIPEFSRQSFNPVKLVPDQFAVKIEDAVYERLSSGDVALVNLAAATIAWLDARSVTLLD